MKNQLPFVHDARELSRIVQAAVNEKNLSMNEVSQRTGLAVPTIMRSTTDRWIKCRQRRSGLW